MSTPKRKPLLTIYKEVLKALGLETDDKGYAFMVEGESQIPFTMKGRILTLPTAEWLANPEWETDIPFHPLSEAINRNKSEIQERITKLAALRVNNILTELILTMVEFAANTSAHAKATVEQKEFLRLLPEADKATYTSIKDLLTKTVDPVGENSLCAFFVRRSGTWKGVEYARLASVTFPIMDEEYLTTDSIYGKKLKRVRDKTSFYHLFRHILPGVDKPDEVYNYGSNSPLAPNFHALMMAFSLVLKDLNAKLKIFVAINPELQVWLTPMTWVKDMSTLGEYKSDIPPLEGNIGAIMEGEIKEERRVVEETKQREVRKENREEYRRGGNRYTSGRGDDSAPRQSWRQSSGRDDRNDRDDRDLDRGRNSWRSSSRNDRDDRYRDRDRDDRGRDRDRDYDDRGRDRERGRDRGETISGISTDFGTRVDDRDSRSRYRR